MSLSIPTKNNVTLTLQNRTDNETWADATETWGESDRTWGDGATTLVEQAKNNVTLSLQTKNNV
jgi:hypothetical protein